MEQPEVIGINERVASTSGRIEVIEVSFSPPVRAACWKVKVRGAWESRHLNERWQAETVAARLATGGARIESLAASAQALRQAANLLAEAGRGGQHVRGEGSRTAFEQRREEAGINIFRMMQQLEQAIELIAHNGSAEL